MPEIRVLRQCYVCGLSVLREDEEELRRWDVLKVDFRTQYRCPKHRVNNRQLATIGDGLKAKKKALTKR